MAIFSRLVVSLEPPNNILATEAATENHLIDLIGYRADEIRGNSIHLLVDPEIDDRNFFRAIQKTALLETTTITTSLKDSAHFLYFIEEILKFDL